MKRIYAVVLVLFAAVFLNASAVKALDKYDNGGYWSGNTGGNNGSGSSNNHNGGHSDNGGKTAPSSPGTNLPINGGVVFLFAAGMIIGVVTLKKFKSLKPALAA